MVLGKLKDKMDPNRPVHAKTKKGKDGKWYLSIYDAESGAPLFQKMMPGYPIKAGAEADAIAYFNVQLLDGVKPPRS